MTTEMLVPCGVISGRPTERALRGAPRRVRETRSAAAPCRSRPGAPRGAAVRPGTRVASGLSYCVCPLLPPMHELAENVGSKSPLTAALKLRLPESHLLNRGLYSWRGEPVGTRAAGRVGPRRPARPRGRSGSGWHAGLPCSPVSWP